MTVVVTGIQGELAPRQEIRTMIKDVPLFTLYLLAIAEMKKIPESDPLSWFQICGIHGRPYTTYDSPGKVEEMSRGYCSHSTDLFPPWHRPYLALFEQTVATHVTAIAKKYPASNPNKQKYLDAAKKFRIPYWDWAYYADPPDVITKEKGWTLDTPDGPQYLDNPLLGYKFHPVDETKPEFANARRFSTWKETLRWPTTLAEKAASQAPQMDQVLLNQTLTIREKTLKALFLPDYSSFSHDKYTENRQPRPQDYISLEDVHGLIHGLVGGGVGILQSLNRFEDAGINIQGLKLEGGGIAEGGHMGIPDFAAFDPIFWMHHANVDRLFAMWQALFPTGYDDYLKSGVGTPSATRKLLPFRRVAAPETFWLAPEVRDTRTFNYTYPELLQWSTLPPARKQERLKSDIKAMYGKEAAWGILDDGTLNIPKPSVPLANLKRPSTFAFRMAAAQESSQTSTIVSSPPIVASAQVAQQPMLAPEQELATSAAAVRTLLQDKFVSSAPASTGEKRYNDWNANVSVEKHAVKTSFFVHVFLGDFAEEPYKWLTEKSLVGSYFVFTNNIETTGCGNCLENAENHVRVTGTVPLTGALGDHIVDPEKPLESLEPEEVIPYLTRHLHWRVQTLAGADVKREDLPSLKLSVVHYPTTVQANSYEFPSMGEAVLHSSVTVGRAGGAGEGEM